MLERPGTGLIMAIVNAMGADVSVLADPEELERLVAAYNALPWEQRRAISDPVILGRSAAADHDVDDGLDLADPDLTVAPSIGPVVIPAEHEIVESAAAAPVVQGFWRLARYFAAPGRTLTAKGNLKIADAQGLVDLLGTGDVYEHQVGEHVYRKRSSTQFRGVDHWLWWARQAGVLRRQGSRLVGVKAWQRRVDADPVEVVRGAFTILREHGVLVSYTTLSWPLDRTLDAAVGPLLARLLVNAAPEAYDDLLDDWGELMHQVGAYEEFPGHLASALDDQLTVLERAGIVAQAGAVHTPDRYGIRQNRAGGNVWLTPVGVLLAVEVLPEQGVDVDVVPPPDQLSLGELVDLATDESIGPSVWWELARSWLAARPGGEADLDRLVQALGEASPMHLLILVNVAPEPQKPQLAPTLWALAFDPRTPRSEAASVALGWLMEHGQVGPHDFEPEWGESAMVDSMAMLSQDDPELGVELIQRLGPAEEQLGFIDVVLRAARPRSAELLDLIGAHHPDKAVAKAARKALFRLRSRRATPPV